MQKMVEDNKILEIITGSQLYGTSLPISDKDYVGIFIAPKEYYLGLSRVEEVDLSVKSKDNSGRNTKDAIDRKLYEFRKYVKLAMENNPNILEMLFVNKENIIFCNDIGKSLLNMNKVFLHTGLKQKFIGYGLSQLHKAHIKVENYDALKKAYGWLYDKMFNKEEAGRLLAEFRNDNIKGIIFHQHHANIGDLNISLTDKLTKVYNKVEQRIGKVGNREELYTKYSADVKFLMHACRLLLEGKELLSTGNLVFPLKEKKFLLEIRNGGHKQEEIVKYAESLIKELDSKTFKTVLPSSPRYKEIENYLIETVSNFLKIK